MQRESMRRVAGLGALTGMRSMAPGAVLAEHVNGERRWLPRRRSTSKRMLSSRRVTAALGLLALGESVADKLPFVPARTEPVSLIGRAAFGGAIGAAVADMTGARSLLSALVGAGAAVAGAAAAYHGRRWLNRRIGVPDPAVGLLEDALVYAAGRSLVADL